MDSLKIKHQYCACGMASWQHACAVYTDLRVKCQSEVLVADTFTGHVQSFSTLPDEGCVYIDKTPLHLKPKWPTL